MTVRNVMICDVEFVVDFEFTKTVRATYDHPADGGEIEIEAICLDGHEVSEMLADWVTDRIKEKLQDELGEIEQDALEDALMEQAEAHYEMRRAA